MDADIMATLGTMFNFWDIISQVMTYVGWGLLVLLIGGFLYAAITFLFLYPYKVYYFELYGSGKDGNFSFGKIKKNYARWSDKKKKSWTFLFPLFNNKKHSPFDSEYIYPGKNCWAFKLNQDYVPGRFNVGVAPVGDFENEEEAAEFMSYTRDLSKVLGLGFNKYEQYVPVAVGEALNEEVIRASLDPIEYDLRNWHETEIKQNELEFQVDSWWEQNKAFMTVLVGAIATVIMVVAGAWLVYKMISEGRPEAAALTSALQNVAKGLGGGL